MIIIFCIVGAVTLILLTVLAFLFYFRLQPLIDSIKKTAGTIAKITSGVNAEMAGPLAQVASFVQGCRQAVSVVKGFFRKDEEEEDLHG
jgi:hypothetical protein